MYNANVLSIFACATRHVYICYIYTVKNVVHAYIYNLPWAKCTRAVFVVACASPNAIFSRWYVFFLVVVAFSVSVAGQWRVGLILPICSSGSGSSRADVSTSCHCVRCAVVVLPVEWDLYEKCVRFVGLLAYMYVCYTQRERERGPAVQTHTQGP